MNKLSLKGKISFIIFSIFLIISAISFNFEQIILSIASLIIALVFAVLLIVEHNKL